MSRPGRLLRFNVVHHRVVSSRNAASLVMGFFDLKDDQRILWEGVSSLTKQELQVICLMSSRPRFSSPPRLV